MISSKLTDLILRNNNYDQNVFSNTSHLFYGVRQISGKLDLQNSYFQLNDEQVAQEAQKYTQLFK